MCPVRCKRVEIPKPDGGSRMLGIPTVLDRWIQQMLLQVLKPIFDPTFSEHSYGFRPGRSAHDAVTSSAAATSEAGKDWVVDMDITKFFDHVNHDILMTRIGQTIRDKRVLRLIGKYLRAGVMIEGVVVSSEEGTPQGGPLSPLLANIYLDALDQELERRGPGFCRYADDCNIYVQQRSGGATGAGERHRSGWRSTSGWRVNATRAEWGGSGNASSWAFGSTRSGNRSSPQERGAIQGESAGVVAKLPESNAVKNCSGDGAPTAGMVELLPPGRRTPEHHPDWRAGYAGTYEAASGCGGTAGGDA